MIVAKGEEENGLKLEYLSHPILRSKPDVHHMCAQDQVVTHIARIIAFQINQCHSRVHYYKSIVLLQKTNTTLSKKRT
jgi:hypothetical protein